MDLGVRVTCKALAIVILELDAILLTVDVDLLLWWLARRGAVHYQRVKQKAQYVAALFVELLKEGILHRWRWETILAR